MTKSGLVIVFLCIFVLCCSESLLARDKNAISAIPRVDVHSHVGSVERMKDYFKVGEALKDMHDINLAIWIDLNFMRQSDGTEEEYLDAAGNLYKGRFLPCINDFKISDGLRYSPEELAKWQQKGIVGYKIWVGVSPLIDKPANDATFAKMEEIMNNEPKYIGEHGRWTYHRVKQELEKHNYREPSVAQRRREEFKKLEKEKESQHKSQ